MGFNEFLGQWPKGKSLGDLEKGPRYWRWILEMEKWDLRRENELLEHAL